MLLALRLHNLAIVDSLEIAFSPGLNVISGETGAGKSIIVGALGFLLAAKAPSADFIRSGEEEAEVEALFEASGQDLPQDLDLVEGGELAIRRVVGRKGRSRAWLNMRLCSGQVASDLGSRLVSICGQHEHQSLLSGRAPHLDILDRHGNLLARRVAVAESFSALGATARVLEAAVQAAREMAQRVDLLRFQAAEIEAANLGTDEDVELENERGLLRAAKRLISGATEAYQLLEGDDAETASAVSRLGSARRRLADLAGLDPRLSDVAQGTESAFYAAQEAAATLRGYMAALETDSSRLDGVEERLGVLHSLKRKYGPGLDDVMAFGRQARQELDSLGDAQERTKVLELDLERQRAECWRLSRELGQARVEAAQRLAAELTAELRQVGMPSAQFSVQLDGPRAAGPDDPLSFKGERLTATGLEEATFMVAPNPGEGFKPLAKVASGGELSRVLLGIKTVLAGSSETLVFDEVDAGLGGAVAEVVGRKLKDLARRQQVICITHLPQIASFADRHFKVAKDVVSGRTVAGVRQLEEEERLEEVARMLGGVTITDKARQHAQEMIAASGVPQV
ncbi:MAG: DNA repair protein RecN [Pseudomonadota bacterium]